MINLKEVRRLASIVPTDIGGGSSIEKISVMVGLADRLCFKTFIEIGIYRGRSFLPIAHFFARREGFSYGVDPYTMSDARELDLPSSVVDLLEEFFENTDYDALYNDILLRQIAFGLSKSAQIIRQTSQRAVNYFRDRQILADMIHIDGNHDTTFVMKDVEYYIPLLKDGGILILDDINWESVKPALDYAVNRLTLIYSTETYAVLWNDNSNSSQAKLLQAYCRELEVEASRLADGSRDSKIKLSVSMITYNQEAYIGAAIQSALDQETNFEYEIVIGEDCSTDQTLSICREFQCRYPGKIRLLERCSNVGAVRNYLETYKACVGEYVAFLEGDDFWIDPKKLQKQVDFLDSNPDYAICFHNVYLSDEVGALSGPLFEKLEDTTTVRDLCTGDYISTPSCVIRNRQIKEIPDWIYDLPGCDWPFDILNAECGKIKCLPGLMAAYRLHDASMWSSVDARKKSLVAIDLATKVSGYLDNRYSKEFAQYIFRNQTAIMALDARHGAGLVPFDKRAGRSAFRNWISDTLRIIKQPLKRARLSVQRKWRGFLNSPRKVDLLIVDDAYPHPQSAFRLEEYDAYIDHFKKILILSTGRSFSFFQEKRLFKEVVAEHEAENRSAKGKVAFYDQAAVVKAKLAYTIFAGNAWGFVEYFEANRVPFVFTLYPGGSFYINDVASDERLRRIFKSPMFRSVIVTQTITRDYLLEHRFCPEDKIHSIYGVVTPRIHLKPALMDHSHFGFDKDTLDICFTAHKYRQDGHDKGYDIFLDVAKVLLKKFPECRFHVVGGFSVDDLPIDGLQGKITFYGGRTQEWLSEFYKDKDIMLSCNVPFVLCPGAFDGFPTGSATDAMLNKLALFCTDPLHLNQKFEDECELVIVPHNVEAIVDRISWYRNNPIALRDLACKGRQAAQRIYSFEAQIAPRLEILRREMKQSEQ